MYSKSTSANQPGTTPPRRYNQTLATFYFSISTDSINSDNISEVIGWEKKRDFHEFFTKEITDVIEKPFLETVKVMYEGKVNVIVRDIRVGSITGTIFLILTVGVTIYDLISKYKDFNESVNLLRNQLQSLLAIRLRRYYFERPEIEINVITNPQVLATQQRIGMTENRSLPFSSIFIWYLFIMNMFFLLLLAVLAYRAMAIVYFGSP